MAMYNKKGQSILEVVIAIAMVSIILITLVALASLSIRASTFSRNQTEAQRLTQQVSEWLRAEKDAGWAKFKSHAGTTSWCLNNLSWTSSGTCSGVVSGTVFTRNLTFTNNADGSVQADIRTSWTDPQGMHTEPTSIIFTNFK
jgi:Tfp pilus assembly protein PilV